MAFNSTIVKEIKENDAEIIQGIFLKLLTN